MRINRYIAASGAVSRREADRLIRAGRVTRNGRVATIGEQIEEDDRVAIDGRPVQPLAEDKRIYLVLNKPPGITTTTDRRRRDNVISFLGHRERLFPVGRLDRDSEGLLLLTNDGDIVNRILRVEYGHEKEYEVTCDRPLDEAMLETMRQGVLLDGQMTLPCRIRRTGERSFRIVLRQGLNRQIRRMSQSVGLEVERLVRVRIMHITLGNLKSGEARLLTPKEVRELKRLTTESRKKIRH